MARKPGTSPDYDPDARWNVRDAKAQLSKVVNGALERPQRIARRDGAAVVVMSEEAYRSLLDRAEGELDIVDYFRANPISDALTARARRPARATARLR